MNFPKMHTEEEKELQIKYDILRRLKMKLKAHENCKKKVLILQESSESSQFYLKKAAAKVLDARDEALRKEGSQRWKTSGFKRSMKQSEGSQALQKKSVKAEYAPEKDLQPRSVTIRGRNLQHEILLESFQKFGEISKISLGCDKETAVVTYKKPENAQTASVSKQKISKENTEWTVELAKQRNSSWVDLAMKEAVQYDGKTVRERHTVHVSYHGKLSADDFKRIFRCVGRIDKIYISSNMRALSPKRQFAFVTFQYETEAERAVVEVNGKVHNGVALTVSPYKKNFKDSFWSPETDRDAVSRELITYD